MHILRSSLLHVWWHLTLCIRLKTDRKNGKIKQPQLQDSNIDSNYLPKGIVILLLALLLLSCRSGE